MSPKKIGIKGKPIGSQAREVINNVINFMRQEAENGVQIPLVNFRQRVIAATGIGRNTFQRIAQEGKHIDLASTSFSTPPKTRQRKAPIIDKITPGEIAQIRAIVYDFYIIEKRRPTLGCILQKITDSQLDFGGKKSTLNKLLKSMGFRWKNTDDNRKALMEKHDIRLKRIEFLKKIIEYRARARNIVYTDETYIHSSHTQKKGWSDENYEKQLKTPVAKGQRLIIVHASGERGFVANSLLIFKSGSRTGDYHNDMNHDNFMKWVETQLIPNIPENSVLVDNASYHNVSVEKNITSASLKSSMINWLNERNFHYEDKWTKAELYQKIQENKYRFPVKYKLDSLMEQHGHSVLRLPPYHPELNPIEKIWALVKNWVAARNVTFKLSGVEEPARTKFGEVGVDEWEKICAHVKKYEASQIEKEHLLDETLEQFRFAVNTGSSDEESQSEDDLDLQDFN